MRRTSQSLCFLGSAAGFLVMSIAVFLFYPASYLALNKGTTVLQLIAFILFWAGLAAGVVLQVISLVLRRRKTSDYRQQRRDWLKSLGTGNRIRRLLLQNRIAGIMAIGFLIGLVGSVASILESPVSSYHTFFFLALTALGLCEYLAFNSLNFAYAMNKEWKL